MKKENMPAGNEQPSTDNANDARPRSGAFREPHPDAEKSTVNNEEADLEQESKEAMTERD